MKLFKKKVKEPTAIDLEIDEVLRVMAIEDRKSENYKKYLDSLSDLYELKAKIEKKKLKVSPDTIAVIAGNLLCILIIVGYERAHPLTSKAMGFLIKGRIS